MHFSPIGRHTHTCHTRTQAQQAIFNSSWAFLFVGPKTSKLGNTACVGKQVWVSAWAISSFSPSEATRNLTPPLKALIPFSAFVRNNYPSILFCCAVNCSEHEGINCSQAGSWLFTISEVENPSNGWPSMQAGHGDFILNLPRELISRLPDAGNNKARISPAKAGIVWKDRDNTHADSNPGPCPSSGTHGPSLVPNPCQTHYHHSCIWSL